MTIFGFSFRSLGLALLVLLFACDGGCSGCEGCGLLPIDGGFPLEERIDNAAQVRLTESGLAFLEDNVGVLAAQLLPGGLTFEVPRTPTTVDVRIGDADVVICGSRDCQVSADIQGADFQPIAPNRLKARLELVLDSRSASSGNRAPLDLFVDLRLFDTTCGLDIDTRRGSRPFVAVEAELAFAEESRGVRSGYTRLDVLSVQLVDGQGIQEEDLQFGGCDGIGGIVINAISDTVTRLLLNGLVDQVQGALEDAVSDFVCTTAGETGCPVGSMPDGVGPDAQCLFEGTDDCVPILLGTDGEGDLGAALLSSFSPGVTGPTQFLLALGGEGEAVNNGLSLFAYGGYRSMDASLMTSPGHNPCVPVVEPPPLPTVNRAGTFRGNAIPGTSETAHVGIGLSEDYLNHAGYGIFDSGMLCLAVGTNLSEMLATGLFGALIPGLPELAFPEDNAPISLALRPGAPPDFTVGATADGEPLLDVVLPSLAIDFYVWSSERYVRFMTLTSDVRIAIDLRVEDGAILPEIGDVVTENAVVSNDELIDADPGLAMTLASLIQTFAGQITGGIGSFDLPSIMGLELEVGENGIVGFTDSEERFIGIFANLSPAGPSMLVAHPETHAELQEVWFNPETLRVATWGQGELPWARIAVDADSEHDDLEVSTRVDGMQWSPWERLEGAVVVQNEAFLFQARHDVEVRTRIAGTPGSEDPRPVHVEVLVDAIAPWVELERSGSRVYVHAGDVLTGWEALEHRVRLSGGEWTEWRPLEDGELALSYDDEHVDVEVRDDAGNVGRAQSALIRGIADPNADGGCDCGVVGGRRSAGLSFLALLLLLAPLRLRAKRRNVRHPKGAAR